MSLMLVDANNLLMRAIKVSEAKGVTLGANGAWTAPIHIFIRMLSKYVRHYHPTSIVVAFDRGHTRQSAIFEGYKANRRPPPDDEEERKTDTFWLTKEFLSLAGVFAISIDGFEADDLISHYWHNRGDEKVIIVSGDKDLLQLLHDDRVVQVRPQGDRAKPEQEEWTGDRVILEMGCRPEQLPYVMALNGDTSDGIPGIPRYGIKTAVKHLTECHWNWDRLLDDPPALLAKQEGYREILNRNLALVDLCLHFAPSVPLSAEVPPFNPTNPESASWNDLLQWLDTYEMATIRRDLNDNNLWR